MVEDMLQAIRTQSEAETLDTLGRFDVHHRNEFAQTGLHECATVGRARIAIALLSLGVDADLPDRKGQTALHYACLHGHLDVAKALLEGGASTHISDRHGNQALWTAVFNARGEYGLVRVLIEAGASPDHANLHGRSPRSFAEQIGDRELQAILAGGQ